MEDENNAEYEEELPPEDEFDLIVIGTGLIEGILAAAAARSRKRVLQLDHTEYYGSKYATFTLTGLRSYCNSKPNAIAEVDPASSTSVFSTEYAEPMVVGESHIRSSLSFFQNVTYSSRKHVHPALLGIFSNSFAPKDLPVEQNSSVVHPAFFSLNNKQDQKIAKVLAKDREFVIDTATKTIPCSGLFIDALINSGVSRYLEFKTSDGVYYLLPESHQVANQPVLWKVPCSKNDIFNSKQLGALEKRALMKFHQFVSDWGRASAGADVTVLNENELAVGRSLYRPQNKAAESISATTTATDALEHQSFLEFLQSYHLSDKLKSLILYALCSLSCDRASPESPDALSAAAGLKELSVHLNSLGRYGDSATLVPMYGIGEVVQGFCRMSAVWAGVCMLRVTPLSVSIVPPPSPSVADEAPVAADVEGAVNDEGKVATEQAGTHSVDKPHYPVHLACSENQFFKAKACVINYAYHPQSICSPLFSIQGIFVYCGKVMPSDRCTVVIPPFFTYRNQASERIEVRNKYAVHVIQSDETACSTPSGSSILHLHTYIEAGDNEPFELQHWRTRAASVSTNAYQLILAAQAALHYTSIVAASKDSPVIFVEIYHKVLLKPVFAGHTPPNEAGNEVGSVNITYSGDHGGFSLHLEHEVAEANRIYKSLFGNDAELFSNDTVDPQDEMRMMEDDDDEIDGLYRYAAMTEQRRQQQQSEEAQKAASDDQIQVINIDQVGDGSVLDPSSVVVDVDSV